MDLCTACISVIFLASLSTSRVAAGGLFCYYGLEFAKAEQDITDNGRRSINSAESKKHCDDNRKHEVIRIWHLRRRDVYGLRCEGPKMQARDGRWDVVHTVAELLPLCTRWQKVGVVHTVAKCWHCAHGGRSQKCKRATEGGTFANCASWL